MKNIIILSYDLVHKKGIFLRGGQVSEGAWIRLRTGAKELDRYTIYTQNSVTLNWPSALALLRILSVLQGKLNFSFDTDDSSRSKVLQFMEEHAAVRKANVKVEVQTRDELESTLHRMGWDFSKRKLTSYQVADLQRLSGLAHGANFSVPGAGKTTVSWALHLLTQDVLKILLVVAPKSAFPAWRSVIDECMSYTGNAYSLEPFTILDGKEEIWNAIVQGGARRFLISYDRFIRIERLIAHVLSRFSVHLVLDESHRMKGGQLSRRGTALLAVSHLAKRRDILSGTPMPQSVLDLQSQLDFLWPGAGLGSRIARGELPRLVLGNLYVRTTKKDLALPPRQVFFEDVQMHPAHLALYSVVRDDIRAQGSVMHVGKAGFDLSRARKSVIRLLQAATIPESLSVALIDSDGRLPALLAAAIQDGPSARILRAAQMARSFAKEGRKTLIWTIFTASIEILKSLLGDLNPVLIYGAVQSGDEGEDNTRESNLRRFRDDPSCWVMIANPAAASEGISLHSHCHDAIYVDRTYNATHFLQSIDRIHRLGLAPDVKTSIYILRNKLPPGIGSIDYSVSRRLGKKIRKLQELLDDPDLHELAMDEENSDVAIDSSIELKDIDDLISELEGDSQSSQDGFM